MRPQLGLLALVAVALACAWPMQVVGDNQNAHYALVKALVRGVPYIDETLGETGDIQSHDVARHEGHLYAVKAPGLAMAATPAYVVVDAVGMRTVGDPTRVLWILNLVTSVAATVILLFLVRNLAERIEPGFGAATAVVLGLGALTLSFATLFFSHALGTMLAFASFWALWRVRGEVSSLRFVAAGVLGGLAVTVEHPAVWVAAILVVYLAVSTRRARRVGEFLLGAAIGVTPLLAFNQWAFADLLHTPYSDYWEQWRGQAYVPVGLPHWDELSRVLFSSLGLITLAPVLAAGIGGAVLLYRRGLRAEACVCLAVPAVLIAYFSRNGAYGGLGPPRYLTLMMPFALVPLAAFLRRFPITTLSLAAVTTFQALVMTATGPLAAYDGAWLERAGDRSFVSTAASWVGITGWYSILPFFAAALAAAGLGLASLPRLRVAAADAALAAAATGAWALVAFASYNDWGHTPSGGYVLTMVAVIAAGSALTWALHRRWHPRPAVSR